MNLNLRLGQPYYRLRLTITTVVTFFLIVSTAPIVESCFSQSKSKGRQGASRQSADLDDVKWALFASDKLYYLTAKEAPELIEALNKSPEIDYQIENGPDCPVTILSARIKGLKVDWLFDEEFNPPFVPPSLPPVDFSHKYLVKKDTVTLKNKTNRPIASLSLGWDRVVFIFVAEAERKANQQIATASPRRIRLWPDAIQPNSTVMHDFGDGYSVYWGRPSIKVEGVVFKDGTIWGEDHSALLLPGSPPPAIQPPPPAPPPIGLMRRSEHELRASAINSIELNKGQASAGVGDRATVQLIISPTGRVACAIYLSGPESMRKPVIDAAKQWRFKPTPGMAVAGVITTNSN